MVKSGTQAERPSWFVRTSDDHGSFTKTDMDSYLALVRKKIQAKCATTTALIQQIRRTRVSPSPQVTPNEFRYTLIKFGIIFDQELVDKLFKVFDSDMVVRLIPCRNRFRPAIMHSNKFRLNFFLHTAECQYWVANHDFWVTTDNSCSNLLCLRRVNRCHVKVAVSVVLNPTESNETEQLQILINFGCFRVLSNI